MKIPNLKKRTIAGITVTILLVIILFINYNSEPQQPKPTLDKDPLNYQDLEPPEPDYSISDNPINKELLTNTWTATSEIAGTNPTPYTELDSQIIFNNDNTFISTTFGLPEQGTYEINKNQIILKDENNAESQTYAEVSETELIILFPQFPKKIIYKKG